MSKSSLYFILLLSIFITNKGYPDEIVLKAGSVAPAASIWMQLWDQTIQKIKEKEKTVKIITYPGGVMGDEEEMIRKIRIGQLHIGAFTINGMKKSLQKSVSLIYHSSSKIIKK